MDHDHASADAPAAQLWEGDCIAAESLYSARSGYGAAREAGILAAALAGPDAARSGVELIAGSLAVAKIQESALAGLVGELTRRKDLASASAVSKLLKVTTDRLSRLAEAHSAALARASRPVVLASQPPRVGGRLLDG